MTSRPRHPEQGASNAVALAARLLRGVETRLEHSAAVGAQASRVAHIVEPGWRSPLNDAAWLHDVGYSPEVAVTGFHPLDGARWLRDHRWPAETCSLVAWHTAALEEALVYGLGEQLAAEFNPPLSLAGTALAWADLTSSPRGERWDAEQRLTDILNRYPPGTRVHQGTRRSLPSLRAAVEEVEGLLSKQR